MPCRISATNTSEKRGRSARMSAEAPIRTKTGCRQPPLPMHGVGERAAWDLRCHTRQSADREREPNVLFRPTQIGQVESEERAEAHLDIGQEKVRPIETPPATVRYLAIPELSLVAMLRDRAARAGVKTDKPLANSGASSGVFGFLIRRSFRTALFQAGRCTHRSCDSRFAFWSLKLLPTSDWPGSACTVIA